MATITEKENWKTLKFNYEITNKGKTQVSDLGNIRTYNAASNGNILNCSTVNGYKILRLKHFKPADEETAAKRTKLEKKLETATKSEKKIIKSLTNDALKAAEKKAIKATLAEATKTKLALKKELSLFLIQNLKDRTIYYNALVHRLVAQYFLNKPTKEETLVTHLNFKKLDNRVSNLKWLSTKDVAKYQQKSPANKIARKNRKENSIITNSKLTAQKVATIKKALETNKLSVVKLAEKYGVSDVQIYRIKSGENWANVKAAL